MKLMILNGVNINMLGIMEKDVYGERMYEDVMDDIRKFSEARGHEVHIFQSNHEGRLIDCIHALYHEKYDGLIFNPGALCHTSYALKDALVAAQTPSVEVHLTNCFARSATDSYRNIMITGLAVNAIMFGGGPKVYELGVKALESIISSNR